MTLVSSNARILREERQLSRLRVQQKSGINYLTLIALDQGGGVTLQNACKLALFFNVSIQHLLDLHVTTFSGEGNQPPPPPNHSALLSWMIRQKPASGKITGLEYHRRKRRLSKRALAKKANITACTLTNLEHGGLCLKMSAKEACTIAEALEVTVDDLLIMHRKEELEAGDRGAYVARIKNPENPVDNYRVVHNLTFRELGKRMSFSCQGAINACERKIALKRHIELLSAYEGISTVAFMDRYGRPV